jgi:hypothetical protein
VDNSVGFEDNDSRLVLAKEKTILDLTSQSVEELLKSI